MTESIERIETALTAISRTLEAHVDETALRFNAIDARFEKVFTILGEHSAYLLATERRLGNVETTLEDTRDDLRSALRVIDIDAERIVDHDRRITRLEASAETT